MSERLRKEILDELNDAWLNVSVNKDHLIRPLNMLDSDQPEEFYKQFTWLMTQPDYFSFLCKHIFKVDILPFQGLILKELWNRKFPMLIGSRGMGKTFLMSLYCMMRALLMPGRKIVVVGAAFRQSKYLHEYMEVIWKSSGVLRDLCDSNSGPRRDVDMCRMNLGTSQIAALPIGDGSKIRGQRANDIISDEFASMSREIFENVIAGFASVSASPAESVKLHASRKKAKEMGIDPELLMENNTKEEKGNQIVLAGTAYYDFNHFSTYWKRWKSIIQSKGDKRKLQEIFGGDEIPEAFNWKDYSVIRIPVELIPKGFMDDAQVARSKATVHNGIYLMEFGACFCTDSSGFFKRSLIEACTGSDIAPIKTPSAEVYFDPLIKGNPTGQYIIGVDPASEVDNFSIIVLEVHPDHRRIVHCWTTTRKRHKEKEGRTPRKTHKDQGRTVYATRRVQR